MSSGGNYPAERFHAEFARFTGLGLPANQAAVVLVPILSGGDIVAAVSAAEALVASLPSVAAAAHATLPSAAAPLAAAPAVIAADTLTTAGAASPPAATVVNADDAPLPAGAVIPEPEVVPSLMSFAFAAPGDASPPAAEEEEDDDGDDDDEDEAAAAEAVAAEAAAAAADLSHGVVPPELNLADMLSRALQGMATSAAAAAHGGGLPPRRRGTGLSRSGSSGSSTAAPAPRSTAAVLATERIDSAWALDVQQGLTLERVQEVVQLAVAVEDAGLLARFVAATVGSVSCLGRSFLLPGGKAAVSEMHGAGRSRREIVVIDSDEEDDGSLPDLVLADSDAPRGAAPAPGPRVAHLAARGGAVNDVAGAAISGSSSAASEAVVAASAPAAASAAMAVDDDAAAADVRQESPDSDGGGGEGETADVIARKRTRTEAFGTAPSPDAVAAVAAPAAGNAAADDVADFPVLVADDDAAVVPAAPPVDSTAAPVPAAAVDSVPAAAAATVAALVVSSPLPPRRRHAAPAPPLPASPSTPLAAMAALPSCRLDVPAVFAAYAALIGAGVALRSPEAVASALNGAMGTATATLRAAVAGMPPAGTAAAQQMAASADGRAVLHAAMALCANPLFEDPVTHPAALALCRAVERLPLPSQRLLSHWFATAGGGHAFMLRADDPVSAALGLSAHVDADGGVSSVAGPGKSERGLFASLDEFDSHHGHGKADAGGGSLDKVELVAAAASGGSGSVLQTGATSSAASSTADVGKGAPAAADGFNAAAAMSRQAPAALIRRVVDWAQQYVTLRLYQGQTSVEDISPPMVLMGLLHAANEEFALIHGGAHAVLPALFANEVVSSEIGLETDFRRWLTDRQSAPGAAAAGAGAGGASAAPRHFSFCAFPFILDAAAKSQILGFDAAYQQEQRARQAMLAGLMGGLGGLFGGGAGAESPYFVLRIRRDRLLEDALSGVVSVPDKSVLKKPLRVVFVGEEGIDAGGVRREFFQLAVRQLFTPDWGMFTEEGNRCLWFNGASLESPVNFELVGSLVGLAIYNSVLLDVHFPLAVYRKLRGEPFALSDLDDFKPELAKGLRALLEYKGDDFEEAFSLDFTVAQEAWGAVTTVPLVPGGASIAVTKANRRAYVHALLRHTLHDAVRPQFAAFARGFGNVAAGPALDLFRAEELALLVTGSAELDFEALEAACAYEGPFNAAHPTVRALWAAVHGLDAEEKRRFLSFVTGCDRAPIRGLGDVRMVLQRAGPDSESLPTASTCFATLLLPDYASADKLRAKLLRAISESEGFGLK